MIYEPLKLEFWQNLLKSLKFANYIELEIHNFLILYLRFKNEIQDSS